MKALHAIPKEHKSLRAAQIAAFQFPEEILKGVAKYLSVYNSKRIRVKVILNPAPNADIWDTFWFEYRYTLPYARWHYIGASTIRTFWYRWNDEQVPEERLEVIYV